MRLTTTTFCALALATFASVNAGGWHKDDQKESSYNNNDHGGSNHNSHGDDDGSSDYDHNGGGELSGGGVVYNLGGTASLPFTQVNGVKYYTMVLTLGNVSADGFVFNQGILINGVFPGPALVATEGDTVSINVVNQLSEPTSMHWHGLFQSVTPYADGATYVTQCPIPVGDSFTYTFQIKQHGTYWYHSHYDAQYEHGSRGPIILMSAHDKTIAAGASDRVITLGDWYHLNGSTLLQQFFDPINNPTGAEPVPESGLINGKGQYNCSGLLAAGLIPNTSVCTHDQYAEVKVAADGRYRVRVINHSAFTSWILKIDGIKFVIVELDGTDVHPTPVDTLLVDIAQRVTFYLAPSDQGVEEGRYVINATMQSQFYPYVNPNLNPTVIGYLIVGEDVPVTQIAAQNATILDSQGFVSLADATNVTTFTWPKPLGHIPALQITPTTPAQRYMFEFRFDNDVATGSNYAFVWLYHYVNGQWVKRFGASSWHPDNNTALQLSIDGAKSGNLVTDTSSGNFARQWNAVPLTLGDVVEITFVNHETVPHPFHFHGHNAQILGRGAMQQVNGTDILPIISDIDAAIQATTGLNYPPIRDVAAAPPVGWMTMRFEANNPGTWTFHCHVDWHLAAGLLMTMVEGQEALAKTQLPSDWNRLCADSKAKGLLPPPAGSNNRVSLNFPV
ncbi:hypothetical protein SmJEL517_g00995 [Synchytrium microbalum]|uniref:Laccase n=1 Tax=Synchytrium microbalum TaxID=1806994 RepID=A0A507CDH0_9FUNG|nr:uncharacterized protein SmJEL517_g00995 [Synchytrium microbalum]TPX37219.1 hypothetical protein SmJEL517_g00995 [Synchytrium microbalum]